MEETPLMKLELKTPLIYDKVQDDLSQTSNRRFGGDIERTGVELVEENEEVLLCFELNSAESNSIEPNREHFLRNLEFIGTKKTQNPLPLRASVPPVSPREEFPSVSLPAGQYLFVQCRDEKALEQEEWLDMAIEQQKDGLWERHKPSNLLYIRYLYEDGAFVTQIFRSL